MLQTNAGGSDVPLSGSFLVHAEGERSIGRQLLGTVSQPATHATNMSAFLHRGEYLSYIRRPPLLPPPLAHRRLWLHRLDQKLCASSLQRHLGFLGLRISSRKTLDTEAKFSIVVMQESLCKCSWTLASHIPVEDASFEGAMMGSN